MSFLKIIRKKLFFLCIIFTSVICSSVVSADTFNPVWPWTQYQPSVYSSVPATRAGDYWCSSTVIQKHYIAGYTDVQDVCMMANSSVRFGLVNVGYGQIAVIGFGNDPQLHQIENICSLAEECLYLPDTDILVAKKFGIVNDWNRSLVIYKNFSNRLTSHYDELSLSLHYAFDDTNPDFIFRAGSNYAWPINGLGASNNGKWLAVEIKSRALGLLNLETFYMKRISMDGYTYRAGNDPLSELAVSNDGAHIAWMGYNASLRLYENTDSCGDEASNKNLVEMNNFVKTCNTARFNYSQLIEHYNYASWPRYSDDGGELSFFAYSNSGDSRKVIARAPGYQSKSLHYLAMGDSYSSGEGELQDQYYIEGTNSEFEKCHTSNRSYPYVVTNLLGYSADTVKSVACSGAQTIDVIGSDVSYYGQWDRLGLGNLGLNELDLSSYQYQALELFIPGRVHQNSFASLYQPSVVTIGIGGNDAGFMGKLIDCLGPTTCKWAGTEKGKEQTAVQIKNQFTKLVNTYKQIREASPGSKIYAIGYPKIIDENGNCSNLIKFLFDADERQFIVENILYLNRVIAAAAASAGVKYIDIYDSFGDHAICGSSDSAMNTIQLGDDMGPFDDSRWFRFIGQESFHPNSLGHALTAATIIDKAGDILSTNIDPIDQGSDVVPEPPLSLLPNGYHDYPLLNSTPFITNRAEPSIDSNVRISFPERSFEPNSQVAISLDGESGVVWSFLTSSTGSLVADFDLPPGLSEGAHVINFIAVLFSGGQVEYHDDIEYWDPTVPEVIVDDPPAIPDVDELEPPITEKPVDTVVTPTTEQTILAIFSDPIIIPVVVGSIPVAGDSDYYLESDVLGDSTANYLPSILDNFVTKLANNDRKNMPKSEKCSDFERLLLILILAVCAIFALILIIRWLFSSRKNNLSA